MKYFYELYTKLPRGGPGDNASTRKAYKLMKNVPSNPNILDIGCGPGIQTLELARISKGKIIALDNYQPFLDKLMQNAKKEGLNHQIIPKNQSMLEMDFDDNTFDVIWSEGALYFMGFQNGLKKCNQLLRENGYLVVTEAVYLLPDPPQPVLQFWEQEYPDISDIDNRNKLIEKAGFNLISHFTLSKSSWIDNFYNPMEISIRELKEKYQGNQIGLSVFETSQNEIAIYKQYSDYFGYEFFIMQKT